MDMFECKNCGKGKIKASVLGNNGGSIFFGCDTCDAPNPNPRICPSCNASVTDKFVKFPGGRHPIKLFLWKAFFVWLVGAFIIANIPQINAFGISWSTVYLLIGGFFWAITIFVMLAAT